MIFLKICYYNFLISAFGFGSGTVFLNYVYNYYVEQSHLITQSQFNIYTAITEMLPGATSVKILTLADYDLLGFKGLIIPILVFILPTMFFIYISSKLLTSKKFNNFVYKLGFYFTPVLTALIIELTTKLTNKNISNYTDLIILIILVINTYYLQEKIKINNFLIIILSNVLIYEVINFIFKI